MISKKQIVDTYRRRASNYDWTANLYYLFGYREYHYRKLAVNRLGLSPGKTVLELGCGTGLNFSYLRKEVGPEGQILGLDLTDAMLEQARERTSRNGWKNVEVSQGDMAEYEYPRNVDGILTTFALSLSPEIDKVINKAYQSLRHGGRMVVLDLREPSNWLSVLRPLIVPVEQPFGVTTELAEARPWETVETVLRRTFDEVSVEQLFGGFSFLACGRKD